MHVLLATDGSDFSIDAAHAASEILRNADRVTVLTVLEEVPGEDAGGFAGSVYSPREQEELWDKDQARARDDLARTGHAFIDAPTEQRIEVGDVAGTICRIAEDLKVDVVVVGSHGRKGLKRMFLGSTSEYVVRHAPCPVLVVRHHRKP